MNLDNRLSNALRFLAIDAIEKSQSGHPGMPMGMADIATVLWRKFLKHNPNNSHWINRDRFILSNGHGSMLLYALLHLSGYNLTLDDLKKFRSLDSKTPGHPEYSHTDGIETTTGPLGQGLANGVGMALAEKILSYKYNKPDINIIDNFTYVFVGDGCLMEGISHEVSSLAGTLKLGKLIIFWDDNGISIDGNINAWFTEDVAKRYRSYGWHVIEGVDGHDMVAIEDAISTAQKEENMPSFICCKTNIGHGSPNKSGKKTVHGSPLGYDEVQLTRKELAWNYSSFEIPKTIYKMWDMRFEGKKNEMLWSNKITAYKIKYPEDYKSLFSRLYREIPSAVSLKLDEYLDSLFTSRPFLATRKSSQMFLEEIAPLLPDLFGGSADLTGSNLTDFSGSIWINNSIDDCNYISYGVREFGMSAIMNGISLYGAFRPYGGTFLVFSDYSRAAIRMSAISYQPVIYVMTHDSIGVGEDGPTHQPVEQLQSLRLIPNLNVWRPCDAIETAISWEESIKEIKTPSILALSRQKLPSLVIKKNQIDLIRKGGYILLNCKEKARLTLIATGSELQIAVSAFRRLQDINIMVNVISMPCVEKFYRQDEKYRHSVVLQNIPAIIFEASHPDLWHRLLPKAGGLVLGISTFGLSAPAEKLYEKFRITVDRVVDEVKYLLQ
jgi:transketolase